MRVMLFNRRGLGQIQGLALRYAFHDIDQYHIGQCFLRQPLRRRRPDIAGSYNRNFLVHLLCSPDIF